MGIEEGDKSAPSDAVCNAAREWMLKHYKDEAIVALRYYTDDEVHGRLKLWIGSR